MRSPYKFACVRCAGRCIPNCSASKLRDGKQAMLYKYDQLNRITKSRSLAFGNNAYAARSNEQKYDEDYSYDANGNILTLKRHDDKAVLSDDFNYSYYANSNKLLKHKTAGGAYEYDAIGNLVKDNNENLSIAWTPSGKVRSVTKPDTTIYFRYDAMGNRIAKIVSTASKSDTTAYVRDASGNVMTVYNNRTATEAPIYGSGRIGEYTGKEKEGYQTFNLRKYELTNHLGNVLAVISDKVNLYGHNNILDSARATVMSASDYYPFGLPMRGRIYNPASYNYGYNGQMKMDEIVGNGNHTTAMYWEYDTRLGRRWNLDPKYNASESRYSVNGNNPIIYLDPNGDFKTTLGAWLYKATHGGEIIRDTKSGQYFVGKQVKYTGEGAGVAYQRRFGWSGQSNPIDFGGKNTFTPWELGLEWLTGTGNREQHFKDGDPFTKLYKQHEFVAEARNQVTQQLSASNGKNTNSDECAYKLSGLKGVPKYIKDYSAVATVGLTGNLAFAYLGSHKLKYAITAVDVENRTATVHFEAHNSSTIESLAHLPVIGYTRLWQGNIDKKLSKLIKSGPMSKTTQTITWSETIKTIKL